MKLQVKKIFTWKQQLLRQVSKLVYEKGFSTILNNLNSEFKFLVDVYLQKLSVGCTYRGTIGNGRKRGTCNEDFLCYSDGKCKPICKVRGSKGDGKNRGSCDERQICFSDGSCRFPGKHFGKT